ncbi:transcription repressor OFP14-like [Silene latifolia]|uniref:transcription repressor OFP14-like n=1 Tax=Silene latifolia TaxID=37657 RepID=UPI003D77364D
MPKNIKKSLQNYISKIKKQVPHLQISHSSLSSTTSRILSGCKHPKSLSFAVDDKGRNNSHDQSHQRGEAATLEDIDNFLVENFKSLYSRDRERDRDHNDNNGPIRDENRKKEKENEKYGESSGVLYYDSPRFFMPSLDRYGSHLFPTSPVSFASPLQEMRLSGPGSPMTSNSDDVGYVPPVSMVDTVTHGHDQHGMDDNSPILKGVEDCIAVLTVSLSPYEDYKRSMKRVIDSRIENNQRVDWEFMEELLICHLRLNDKKQHRFILSAFVDLIVVLRQTLAMEN